MNWRLRRGYAALTFVVLVITISLQWTNTTRAVGILYADPGWYNILEGDSAYYHDPDGYNTDYNTGSATNEPGGQTNQPGLINPGPCSDCAAAAIWQNNGSHWDGSAPGAPLGGVPNPPWNPTKPFLGPAAPGGVGTYNEGSTTFLRIQDPGDPAVYGWVDKYSQLSPSKPQQEGGNKRIEFKHEMSRDPLFSDRQDILDFGVTLTFRARIATAATGPLDMIYDEAGSGPFAWPADGIGYRLSGNGRAMVFVSQTSATYGPSRVGFSLLNTNSITGSGVPTSTTGLVMNNTGAAGSVDTNVANASTLNIVEIPDQELIEWHEFWITIKGLASPVNGNTHEVNVYRDGLLTPQTFQVALGLQNEAGTGSFLSVGLTSGSQVGAFDLDFIAYKEGVFAPTLAGLPGDFNQNGTVDAADYAIWRNNVGTTNTLPNDDGIGGTVGTAHYNLWRSHFGQTGGAGSGVNAAAVPEPSTLFVLLAAGSLMTLAAPRSRAILFCHA